MKKPTIEIKLLAISDIKPYWRNPRRGNVNAVKESIKSYGYNQFIVVDKDYIIIVGHSRYKALSELAVEDTNFKKINVIVSDMDKAQAKEYRIVDNKTGDMSVWDIDTLSQELKELDTNTLMKYFNQTELDSLIKKTVGAIDYSAVDSAGVDKARLGLDNQMQGIDQQRRTQPKIVICPKCNHEFQVE